MPAERTKQERRVFLVVVDQTPELNVALRYACRRARATGGRLAMLYVTEPATSAEWLAVSELMREDRSRLLERRRSRRDHLAARDLGCDNSVMVVTSYHITRKRS